MNCVVDEHVHVFPLGRPIGVLQASRRTVAFLAGKIGGVCCGPVCFLFVEQNLGLKVVWELGVDRNCVSGLKKQGWRLWTLSARLTFNAVQCNVPHGPPCGGAVVVGVALARMRASL